ncbi:hypothetical protein J4Q44_G00160610 [Coregonus suidteri]|uniref:Atos homolog protein B n=1 Tax=Coregonus suidteri TaxID=861788 RepID=A0AAN8LN26_9TELE
MRHIHVELTGGSKEELAPVELPSHEGDLSPPEAPSQGPDPGVMVGVGVSRHFGQEQLRLQKVYQLSIFSQLGGFSSSEPPRTSEAQPGQAQRTARPGVKRGLEEPKLSHKWPHLAGDTYRDGDALEGGVLCGPGPGPGPLTQHGASFWGRRSGLLPGRSWRVRGGLQYPPGTRGGQRVRGRTGVLPAPSQCHRLHQRPGLPEKTPSTSGFRGVPSGPWQAKKKLISSSDTAESCSEDEGPSTSKRSRLALLAPGLGLASCRGTDAKAAPFWNHLLPNAQGRDHPKSVSECSRASRRLSECSRASRRLKSRQLRSGRRTDTLCRSARSGWPSSSISRSLLGNFEESILKGRFPPSGHIEGFTAEIGASGSYCPPHATLPVHVTYYDISEHSAPSPFLGVISLEPLGKKGYSVPKAGTIQVTLFNPNKTVVKMFLVTYNFGDMPVNHMTFLRHRIFLVPVEEAGPDGKGPPEPRATSTERRKILCYLIHLRFQSSKSGKIYLHNDIRLLFSRKSIEVDTGIPYELKSFTEVPRNPKYSPRV